MLKHTIGYRIVPLSLFEEQGGISKKMQLTSFINMFSINE